MPRFALLAHDYPSPHWDLFLEAGAVLRSWRILSPLEHGSTRIAEAIGDHRLVYLDYEGPVSGGRGTVWPIDRGSFEWLTDNSATVAVRLEGLVFRGELVLRSNGTGWTAQFNSLQSAGAAPESDPSSVPKS